jgi:hypothetical protein
MSKGGQTRIKIMRKVFPWIACAKRPLTIEEINEAYAINAADKNLQRQNIPTDHKRILEACGSLVLFDKDCGTVTFAHKTVLQFLVSSTKTSEIISTLQFKLEEADFRVGEACITYLCFSDFETQVSKTVPTKIPIKSNLFEGTITQTPFGQTLYNIGSWFYAFSGSDTLRAQKPFLLPLPKVEPPSGELEEKYRLLNYVASNWHSHTAQFAPTRSPSLWAKFTALTFESKLPFDIRPWVSSDTKTPSEDDQLPHLEIFRWAAVDPDKPAFLQLLDHIESSAILNMYLDHEVTAGQNPLFPIMANGHYALFRNLLEKGKAHVHSKDTQGRSLVSLAVEGGYLAVVEVLLNNGVNVHLKDSQGRSLVLIAVEGGYVALTELLLGKVANVESTDAQGRTLIYLAVQRGCFAMIEPLVSNGASIEITDAQGRSLLLLAAEKDQPVVVELLLSTSKEDPSATRSRRHRLEATRPWWSFY